ncbi:MAG: LysM peptidoglycan-binding domain-containing protein [Lachnospiraceae bacterium]|nr:LysM peptidoglycan-binding domain-containing protein [Lachnospiraceae bacterium]
MKKKDTIEVEEILKEQKAAAAEAAEEEAAVILETESEEPEAEEAAATENTEAVAVYKRQRYAVRLGDSLKSIAATYGHDLAELARINNLNVDAKLYIGQILEV